MFIGEHIWENSFKIQKLTLHYIITTSKKSWNNCKTNLVLNLRIFFYGKYLWKSLQPSHTHTFFPRFWSRSLSQQWNFVIVPRVRWMRMHGSYRRRVETIFIVRSYFSSIFAGSICVMFVIRCLKNGGFCCKNRIKTWENLSFLRGFRKQ